MLASSETATSSVSRPSSERPMHEDLHARRGFFELAHVAVDVLGVGEFLGVPMA